MAHLCVQLGGNGALPYEPIIRWIALGLIGLGVAWIIVEAIGLRPRAIRVRRAIRRSGAGSLLCGNCGHPAVSLGEIEACPECGSRYAEVGLDGRASGSRWSPPAAVLFVLLLGLWALGSVWLSPIAARWANERSIGAPTVARERMLLGLTTRWVAQGTSPDAPPSIAVEIDAELVRPNDPVVSLVPPPLPTSTIVVRLAMGPGVSTAASEWEAGWHAWAMSSGVYVGLHASSRVYGRFQQPAAPPPPPPLASPWASMFASTPPHEAVIDAATWDWVVRDPSGVVVAEGRGQGEAISALFDHAGLSMMAKAEGFATGTAAEAVADAMDAAITPRHPPSPMTSYPASYFDWSTRTTSAPTDIHLYHSEVLEDNVTTHVYHRAAPWGLAVAIATSALLLLLAMILVAIAWPSRRVPSRGASATS